MYHLTPTFHYDVIYLKDSREYSALGFSIIDRALELLMESPEYTFTIEQTILVEEYLTARPEALPKMRSLAQSGRLEFAPGMYVMPDMNLVDGESLFRQAFFGISFLEEQFGVRPAACWIADCWGHHAQLPQILVQCGYSSYFFWRCMRPEVAVKDFLWEGLDGTRIPTHWMARGYGGIHLASPERVENAEEQTYTAAAKKKLDEMVRNSGSGGNRETFLIPSGGDFCMPQREAPVLLKSLAKQLDRPIAFSTPSAYSTAACRENLTVVTGEFNGAFQGTYTTNIRIKQRTESARTRLISLEKLHALSGRQYDLAPLWKMVLKCQFHDTICGTVCDDGVREAEADLARIERELDALEGAKAVFAFNPLGQSRREILSTGGKRFAAVLPPLGTVALADCRELSQTETQPALPTEYANSFYRCRFDGDGCMISLCRVNGGELIAAGQRFGLLSMQLDYGDSWLNFQSPLDGGCAAAAFTDRQSDPWNRPAVPLVNNRTFLPSFSAARMVRRDGETRVTQAGSVCFWKLKIEFETEIVFRDDSPLIRYRTSMTSQGKHFRLRVAFPTAIEEGRINRAIPFGIQPGDHSELPAAGFFDCRSEKKGLSVLARGLYGSCVDEENVMLLTLFRSTAMEYKCASELSFNEGRKFQFEYALLPGEGGDDFSEVTGENDRYTFPVLFTETAPVSLPLSSLPEHIRLSALKRVDDRTIFCRLAETAGISCECNTDLPVAAWASADGLERIAGEVMPLDGTLTLKFRAFEIKNILLYSKR